MIKLLSLIEGMPGYSRLVSALGRRDSSTAVALEAAKPYLLAALHLSHKLPMLVVTARPENSKKLYEQLLTWLDSRVKLFPEPDVLPYEHIDSDITTELERVQVLAALARGEDGGEVPLVVASAPALMGKLPLYTDFTTTGHIVELGMDIEPFRLLSRWEAMGYRMENLVEVPGTMSHRGGIIDIYPPTSKLPARLEFFGDTVDNLRLFDPASQRSTEKISSIVISPATELLSPRLRTKQELEQILDSLDLSGCNPEVKLQFQQETDSLLERQRPRNAQFYAALFNQDGILNYLPEDVLLVLDEPASIQQVIEELDQEAAGMYSDKLARGELPGNYPRPYFTWEELEPELQSRQRLVLNSWGIDENASQLGFTSAPGFSGKLPSFITKVRQLRDEKRRLIIVSHLASRLSELLGEEGIIASPLTGIEQLPPGGSVTLVQGSLAEGWVMNDETCLLTDAEIFGFVKQRRLIKKRPTQRQKLLVDITPGDYVVHIEHGIARFSGVNTLGAGNSEREYLVLQYAAGDKLYVPTDQIDRVNRYVGAGDHPPVMSRLGTQEWNRTKQRANEAAEELARELLTLYSAREIVNGFAFSHDTLWQQELEASFPYVETPDQVEVQREVKDDMEKAKPMDRLVCGDVGYGKTEVAVRAAFKAIMDNKQVAVLVPTTVLAEQHYATFSERFEAFPVRIEVLSRFKSAREQHAVLEGLAGGNVDICIGTHRLLQKDIVFKDLGLLIIDEEQRFGVAHKEYLKQKRQEIDVLTLSATPIPRTLHMSLVGVRDMSTMETPPEERLPIKTYVAEYNDRLIREAALRELERNGQIFFVHNRVNSIALIASRLEALVPEARIAVAHGRMSGEELEAEMTDFARGRT
ncbi:transcription-repair coupling factor, partial [Chloroflexota bacterium]